MSAGFAAAVLLLVGVWAAPLCAADGPVNTRDLVVSDASGTLATERLMALADQAQSAAERIAGFWSADAAAHGGRIRVIFDRPARQGNYMSVFIMERSAERVVRVVGFDAPPQQMAHKLTSAIFPQADKLIRNMMGVATEVELGNRFSFPACGFAPDDWVRAFLKGGTYIPLAALGPDHESWGMRFAGGMPVIHDRSRQHRGYAEAGSLGAYVIAAYGVDKLKQFHQLSRLGARPWQSAFGAGVEEIEAAWLIALKSDPKASEEKTATLASLFAQNPNTACFEARKLAFRS